MPPGRGCDLGSQGPLSTEAEAPGSGTSSGPVLPAPRRGPAPGSRPHPLPARRGRCPALALGRAGGSAVLIPPPAAAVPSGRRGCGRRLAPARPGATHVEAGVLCAEEREGHGERPQPGAAVVLLGGHGVSALRAERVEVGEGHRAAPRARPEPQGGGQNQRPGGAARHRRGTAGGRGAGRSGSSGAAAGRAARGRQAGRGAGSAVGARRALSGPGSSEASAGRDRDGPAPPLGPRLKYPPGGPLGRGGDWAESGAGTCKRAALKAPGLVGGGAHGLPTRLGGVTRGQSSGPPGPGFGEERASWARPAPVAGTSSTAGPQPPARGWLRGGAWPLSVQGQTKARLRSSAGAQASWVPFRQGYPSATMSSAGSHPA